MGNTYKLVARKERPEGSDLERHRERIDSIDDALVRLLCQRARVAMKIGVIKKKSGMPVRCRKREDEVLARAVEQADGTMPPESIQRLFRAIIAETRMIETLEVTHAR